MPRLNDMPDTLMDCIEDCTDCHAVCIETVTHCLHIGGRYAEPDHIRLLLDCADICQTSANYLLRSSDLHALTCQACAGVCDRCAQDCERLGDDPRVQGCIEACRRCAESCRMVGAAA
jgi:hypothetical protein